MMVEESDGIGEAFDGQLRVALAAAMQIAQHVARLREELARTGQARTEQQTRELQVRFDADRAAARASLIPAGQPGWWEHASVTEIADAYETTQAWAPLDRDIAATGEQMREELRSRHGLDLDNLQADPAAVRDAIARGEQARTETAHSRGESSQDYTEAATLLAAADQLDKLDRDGQQDNPRHPTENGFTREEIIAKNDGDRSDGAVTYDSAERRDEFAADMENKNVNANLQKVRLAADRENATHPSAAVSTKPGRQGKSRNRSQKPGMTRERGGITR